jgi:hypothetical protein
MPKIDQSTKAEQRAELQKQKQNDCERICMLLSTGVPKSYHEWFYQRTADFKDACLVAISAATGRNTPEKTRKAMQELERFYK